MADEPRRDSTFTMTRAFISFDFEHDKDLRGNLVSQEKRPDSPFSIVDYSMKEPIESKWRVKVRDQIRKSDIVIVICGEHTDMADGVQAELTIAREERKPYFLLRGRSKKICTKLGSALRSDEMHKWTWPNLQKLIATASGS